MSQITKSAGVRNGQFFPAGARKTDAGPLKRVYLNQLGFGSSMLSKIISQKNGGSTRNIQAVFELFGGNSRLRESTSPVVTWFVGRDRLRRGHVVSTVTPAGSGYSSVDIIVNGPENTNIAWYSVGNVLRDINNRNFIVDAITSTTTGQQLTLRPLDGVANLVVGASGSLNFPNNIELGDLGIAVNPDCYVRANQRRQDVDTYENSLTIIKKETARLRSTAHSGFSVKLDLAEYGEVEAWMSNDELFTYNELMDEASAQLFFGERNVDPSMGYYVGHGLINQVDSRLKVPLELSDMKNKPFKYLQGIMRHWDNEFPNTVSDEILLVVGSNAFYDLQEGLTYTDSPNGKVDYYDNRRDALTSMAEAERKLYLGTMFDGMVSWSGKKVFIKRVDALDEPRFSTVGDMYSGKFSVHSHDMFLMDMGKKKNMNPQTGVVQDENDFKINMYCLANPNGSRDDFQNIHTPGSIDVDGNAIPTGEVFSFDGESRRYMQVTRGITVEDPSAVVHISKIY